MFPLLNRNVPHVEHKILAYLGPKDLVTAAFVCKEWYAATGEKEGKAVLLKAVATGCEHLVAYILEDQHINVNEHWICSLSCVNAIWGMTRDGTALSCSVLYDGNCALLVAVMSRKEEMVKLLLKSVCM